MIRTQAQLSAALASSPSELELAPTELLVARNPNKIRFVGEVSMAAPTGETPLFHIVNGTDISVTGMTFEGRPAAQGWFGRGLGATGCHGLEVSGCTFRHLYRGAVIETSRDVAFERNDLFTIQSDGFQFAALTDATICENRFEDFRPITNEANSLDHPDAIQGYAANRQPGCVNVLVARNMAKGKLDQPTQGIQIKSENASRHSRIRILDNLMLDTLWNGIALGHSDDSEIIDNIVAEWGVTSLGREVEPWIRVEACAPVITGNSAPYYKIGKMAWDHVPPGNARRAIDALAIEAARADWLARYRAPLVVKPTLAEVATLLDQAKAMLAAMA